MITATSGMCRLFTYGGQATAIAFYLDNSMSSYTFTNVMTPSAITVAAFSSTKAPPVLS